MVRGVLFWYVISISSHLQAPLQQQQGVFLHDVLGVLLLCLFVCCCWVGSAARDRKRENIAFSTKAMWTHYLVISRYIQLSYDGKKVNMHWNFVAGLSKREYRIILDLRVKKKN